MNPQQFTYQARPGRVVFGEGALEHLEREVVALGATRALVLCTPEQLVTAEMIAERLGASTAGVFSKARMHVPIEIAREAQEVARSLNADCAVAVGGGSTIGLGKAIALDSGLPILAVPTTYAGSEMTPVFGLTEDGIKRTGTDLRVLPRTVIYDPALTMTLPKDVSITSAVNALAHAAEGLYAREINPITEHFAVESIRSLGQGIAKLFLNDQDLSARSQLQYGAWMAGTVLGSVGMALHHKLCHTLGGSFNLPHSQTHTIVLPHALAYNAVAVPRAMELVSNALGSPASAARAVYDLAKLHGAPTALRELGMTREQVDKAAEIASTNPYWNPRPIERKAIHELLMAAFEGIPPE